MQRFFAFGTLFASLTFNALGADVLQIYDLALMNDPQLAAAEATRNAVLENRPQSIARLLPSINFQAAANRTHQSVTGSQGVTVGTQTVRRETEIRSDYWDSSLNLRLVQPVYHHDMWVQLAQADAQIAEAEANYLAKQQDLMVRSTQAYFKILEAMDNLEFAGAEKRSIERQLDQAKERFEVGLNAITDVHEAQAGYDQAVASEIVAANQLDSAWEALREIIGQSDQNTLKKVKEALLLRAPEPSDMERWNGMALEHNLGIIAADNRAKVAEKNIDVRYAGHLPTVDLVGTYSFTDNTRPIFFGTGSESNSIGLQLNVPIFQGGAVSSQVRQARHNFEAAKDDLDRQRRATTRQVKDSYRGVMSTISQVGALKAAVVSSQSALEASEAGFQVGTRTMVEVLTGQRNLTRAKRDYAKARYDYLVNGLLLRQAAGILTREDLEQINRNLE